MVLILIIALWAIHFIQYFGIADFTLYGNMPRKPEGLWGLLFAPYLHGDTNKIVSMHLLSNSLPILILLTVLLHTFPRHALLIWIFIQVTSELMVWCLGTEGTIHIGISGIVYGLTGFFLASGIFRRDRNSMLVAVFVAILYGGSVVGFLPQPGVSWQSHLYGFISGVVAAYSLRHVNLPATEMQEDELHFFERVKDDA